MPGKITDANEAAVRQSGLAKDELVQKSLLDLCSRDLFQRSRAIMMELLTRGEARFETEKIKKDGSLLPVEISVPIEKIALIPDGRELVGYVMAYYAARDDEGKQSDLQRTEHPISIPASSYDEQKKQQVERERVGAVGNHPILT